MEWKQRLPEKLRVSLETLLDKVNKHEDVYMQAQNASVGQMWVSMAQMNHRVEKLEAIVQAQRKALNEMDVDVNVDKRLNKDLEESLRNY
jgi:uncharacterized coiled-coil protein SlyX